MEIGGQSLVPDLLPPINRVFDIQEFRPVTTSGKHKAKPDPAAKLLMRLQIDDMGAIGRRIAERRIVRVRKITNANGGAFVVLDDHNEANVDRPR